MAKMTKKDIEQVAPTPMDEMPEPPSCVRVTKEQAKDVSVGETLSVTIEGKVKAIQECYDKSGKYEIQLSDSKTTDISGNKADKELANFMGGKKK